MELSESWRCVASCPVEAWCSGAVPHPPALSQCSISRASWWDQRAGAAAIPRYVRSVQACFASRISGNEVTWAAVPLSSRDGDKSWMGNLELLEGYVWNGTALLSPACLRDWLSSLVREAWA